MDHTRRLSTGTGRRTGTGSWDSRNDVHVRQGNISLDRKQLQNWCEPESVVQTHSCLCFASHALATFPHLHGPWKRRRARSSDAYGYPLSARLPPLPSSKYAVCVCVLEVPNSFSVNTTLDVAIGPHVCGVKIEVQGLNYYACKKTYWSGTTL